MQALTPADWAIVAVVGLSVAVAFWHGLLVELFSLLGLVGGLLVAGREYPALAPWMERIFHEQAAASAAAFLLVALGVMLAAAILGRVLRWILRGVGLGWADRLAGGAFGLVKGYILVALGLAALAAFFPREPWFDQSRLVPYFSPGARGSGAVLPRDLRVKIQAGLHSLAEASGAPQAGPAN
jgi:membrane protein required for colicin V production